MGAWKEVLRLIINLVPSNELFEVSEFDTGSIPHVGQWISVELLGQELLLWSGDDMRCAFYLFGLPVEWAPYMVIDGALDPTLFGQPAGEDMWLYVRVVPMGWINAVGVCQYLMRRLSVERPPAGAGLPRGAELRKDRNHPVNVDLRCSTWWQAYLDGEDLAEAMPTSDARRLQGEISEWQSALRGAMARHEIPLNTEKGCVRSFKGETLGGSIDGEVGRAHPSGSRWGGCSA